jgi:hypothetical protein
MWYFYQMQQLEGWQSGGSVRAFVLSARSSWAPLGKLNVQFRFGSGIGTLQLTTTFEMNRNEIMWNKI